jgi:predicted DCC family thiol-disulfide oxidoreductase YuxK
MYDRFALSRYTLVGRYAVCMMPDKQLAPRFLNAEVDVE